MLTVNQIESGFATPTNSGFGNHLFMIASTIGIAIDNGYKYGFRYQFECFKNPLPVCTENFPEYRVPWGFFKVNPPPNRALYGYMQSERYFKHCPKIIRYYFEMKEIWELLKTDNADLAYEYSYFIPENAIILHVRRGDYEGESHHAVLTREYYDKALQEMDGGPVFVFSDEPHKATELFDNSKQFTYVQGNSEYVDFWLMRQGKKHIIANSTFSWWPAWLNGEKVIAPSRWFEGSCRRLETKDLYPESWQII